MPHYRFQPLRSDPEDSGLDRALSRAVGMPIGAVETMAQALRAGFPAYHEGQLVERDELARFVRIDEGVVPERIVPDASAAAAVMAAWQPYRAMLEARAPEALRTLGPPGTAEHLHLLERQTSLRVHAELTAWLSQHDGATYRGPFEWALDSIVGIAATKQFLDGMHLGDGADTPTDIHADPAVAPVWWHAGWLPFAENGAGDHLCVDMSPTDHGRVGQIVLYRHDDEHRDLVASSLSQWIEDHATRMGQGELVAADDAGHFIGILPRSSLTGSLVDVHVRGEPPSSRLARIELALGDPAALACRVFETLKGDGLLVLVPGAFAPMAMMALSDAARTASAPQLAVTIARVLRDHEDVADQRADEAAIQRIIASLLAGEDPRP